LAAIIMPSSARWNNPTASAPKMNNGLAVFVNEIRRSASIREICLRLRNIALIFAPEGYPLAIPIIQAKLPMPGILNKGRIIGSNKTPINFTTPKQVNNSAAIKNGSKDGNTTLHHISSPRILAWKLVSGNIIMESEINKSINAMNIVYNFCFNLLPPQRYG